MNLKQSYDSGRRNILIKMENNTLYWAKLKSEAIIPTKREEDAGYDIYPCFEENYKIIPAHSTVLVPTGLAVAMSDNYYLQAHERGGTGSKGIKVSAGVIDSGFRGEIFIAITNANNMGLIISKIDEEGLVKTNQFYDIKKYIIHPYTKAIAQLIVHIVPKMTSIQIPYDELVNINSTRGTGMLGSSNK